MDTAAPHSGFLETSDGVRLRYTQQGPTSAPNLLLLPGWAQTAAQFQRQVDHFRPNFRVTTYDHRGHGESDKPAFGYRICRLAADLEDLMTGLDLRDVTLVGHSMGASVVWAHWDLFPHTRISKLVLVDQSPVMTANPAWSAEKAAGLAAIFSAEALYATVNGLCGPEGKATHAALTKSMFTSSVDPGELAWAQEQSRKMPLELAGPLLLDHATIDWRDVIPRINVPTLAVGSKGSLLPAGGMQWVAAQIPGGRLEIFEEADGGSHFMFWENAEKFNKLVEQFLTS